MGIFGQLDAANIPTNPFFIEAGEYEAVITESKYRKTNDGEKQLYIQYTVDDENSQYHDSKAIQTYTLPADDMTQEKFDLLPPEEKKKIRRVLSSLKKTLCGADGNTENQPGLGVDPEALNDDSWDPGTLVNTRVTLAIYNYGKDGVGIRWANVIR